MEENRKNLKLLAKPLNSDVDHFEILSNMYYEYMKTGRKLSSLMKYYLNGLDEVTKMEVKDVWSKEALNTHRQRFVDSYPELLEILQNDYESFKFNFRIIRADEFNAEIFKEYPSWSEYYDYDELDELEKWGYNKKSIIDELLKKEIEGQHPYYSVPITSFPLDRMRYFTRSKFRTKNNIELDGAIMNEGELVVLLFLDDKIETLNRNPTLKTELEKNILRVANYYKVDPEELYELTFETVIPIATENRIRGTWRI